MLKEKIISYSKSYLAILFAIAFAATIIGVSFLIYVLNVHNTEKYVMLENLQNIAERNVRTFKIFFQGKTDTLKEMAFSISLYGNTNAEGYNAFLLAAEKRWKNHFSHLALEIDGKIYTPDGSVFDFAMSGAEAVDKESVYISDTLISAVDGRVNFLIRVPVYNKDNKVRGVLWGSIDTGDLSREFSAYKFDGLRCYHLIDSAGIQIVGTEARHSFNVNADYFKVLETFEYKRISRYSKIVKDIANKASGAEEFVSEKEKIYSYYMPVGINNWYLFVAGNEQFIEKQAQTKINMAVLFAVLLALALFVVFASVVYMQKKFQTQLALDESCFRLLARHSNMAVLEWNYAVKDVQEYHCYEELYEIGGQVQKEVNDLIDESMIHPDDLPAFQELFNNVKNGKNFPEGRVRLKGRNGDYRYFLHLGTVIHDSKGNLYKTIAFFEDIDREVKEEERLRHSAERDLMTGLFNKVSTENLIVQFLEQDRCDQDLFALFVVDIDNFKPVNDLLGHQIGDAVIGQVAETLKHCFRDSDIVGRVGGDEFVAFAKNVHSADWVTMRAQELNKALRLTHASGDEDIYTTVSIGIALGKGNCSLSSLYKLADDALYLVKEAGKDSFRVVQAEEEL